MTTKTQQTVKRCLPLLVGGGALAMAALVAAETSSEPPSPMGPTGLPAHEVQPSKSGNLVVGLCDGKTSVEVAGVKPGTELARDDAQAVSNQLMAEWKRAHPEARWEMPAPARTKAQNGAGGRGKLALADTAPGATKAPQKPDTSAETSAPELKRGGEKQMQTGHTYGAFGPRDEALWRASTQAFVDRGKTVFHDVKELGGTVGITCDMCHPDASNTHPETYPKFQVQLGRVALLRDMINWCIENPVRGKPLKDDDERLRAMEAYIFAQRKGSKLDYGKH